MGAKEIKIKRVVQHPKYDNSSFYHDIAAIMLVEVSIVLIWNTASVIYYNRVSQKKF